MKYVNPVLVECIYNVARAVFRPQRVIENVIVTSMWRAGIPCIQSDVMTGWTIL